MYGSEAWRASVLERSHNRKFSPAYIDPSVIGSGSHLPLAGILPKVGSVSWKDCAYRITCSPLLPGHQH